MSSSDCPVNIDEGPLIERATLLQTVCKMPSRSERLVLTPQAFLALLDTDSSRVRTQIVRREDPTEANYTVSYNQCKCGRRLLRI